MTKKEKEELTKVTKKSCWIQICIFPC